jgi:hypothetical protein
MRMQSGGPPAAQHKGRQAKVKATDEHRAEKATPPCFRHFRLLSNYSKTLWQTWTMTNELISFSLQFQYFILALICRARATVGEERLPVALVR